MVGPLARRGRRGGVTLVELAVVILVVGVLASFGVPRFLSTVERSKASQAFAYLSAIREAQGRHRTREGVYAGSVGVLGLASPRPVYFSEGPVVAPDGLAAGWSLTLTRAGESAGGYGAYTLTFNQDGYDPANSTLDGFPAINPASAR